MPAHIQPASAKHSATRPAALHWYMIQAGNALSTCSRDVDMPPQGFGRLGTNSIMTTVHTANAPSTMKRKGLDKGSPLGTAGV